MRFPFARSFAGSLVLVLIAASAGCADDPAGDPQGNVGQAESGGAGGRPNVGQGGKAGGAPAMAGSGGSTPRAACTAPATYRNLFTELLGKTDAEVASKLEAAYQKLFHGGDNETVYYESGTDEAYILDVNSNDVRSEGMSYGMMIAVQLDKRDEFDRLWKWSMSHMYQAQTGYFAWQLTPEGQVMSPYSAPDGEEYFATALVFAANRWGDGTGIFAYSTQARALLDALVNRGNFNRTHKLVTFGASGQSAMHTDPSYILPAFYEVWACYDSKNQQFWKDAVKAARAFFPKTCHATTGLAPYQANFDGTPYAGTHFQSDSWRVVGNIMMDHNLFAADPWQTTFATNYARFFSTAPPNADQFLLDGTVQNTNQGPSRALVAQNAMVAFGVPAADGTPFVQKLWDMSTPTGQYRYYDGMLYLLSYLHVSGRFQLWF